MMRSFLLRGLSAAALGALLVGCGPSAPSGESATDVASTDADAAGTEAPFRTYDAATFYLTTTYVAPSGHAFSADGERMLLTSDASGVFNVHEVDRASGEIEPLTASDDHAIFAQSYFPDDDRVLYTYDEGGDELNHIVVRETDGSTRDLTPGEELKAQFVGWHEDGEHFYLATNERDASAFDLYRYATDGYERERVYENTNGWSLAGLSPDGRHLVLTENISSADSNLHLVDLEAGGEPELITPHEGAVAYSVFDFTPDGSAVVYGTNEHGEFQEAWTHDIASGEKAPLVTADWNVVGVVHSNTGRYRVSYVNRDAVIVMDLVDTTTGESVALPEIPEGEVLNVRFDADDERMSFMVNSDTRPSDLFVVDLTVPAGERVARAYTDALNPQIDRDHLVEGEVVRYESFDGLEIPSILYRPKQASAEDPVPALVLVHGGPGGQTTKGYRAMVQHLVNQGYAILGANNRGSSGYGKTFYHMDDQRHGEEDLRDIVEGRTYLESLDWVDPERIGVIGGSYGGYMTAAALAFHPEAFDVGINIFGVTNWVRTLESIPPWWGAFRDALYDEMGDPATDAERHRRISPLFHAENIVRPMLVVQGANDPRVLKVESDELVAAVRENEVPVEYVVFEDEGHGFRKRSNRIEASQAYVRFLDEHLKGEDDETAGGDDAGVDPGPGAGG
jgi:dipeptidyl aminopeptidase/acylaminoacyl peptidase